MLVFHQQYEMIYLSTNTSTDLRIMLLDKTQCKLASHPILPKLSVDVVHPSGKNTIKIQQLFASLLSKTVISG